MDNLRNYTTSHGAEFIINISVYFLRYAVSLCKVLPTIGQYSIDITIKHSFKCLDRCPRSHYSLQFGPRVLMYNRLEIIFYVLLKKYVLLF